MAKVKISALPTATAIDGTETIPIVQGGTTKRATTAQLPAVAATTTQAGALEVATAAEVYAAATSNKALVAEHIETASAAVTLTDAATVAVDWDAGINFDLTVAGNRTIGNPTNGQPRTWRTILVKGDDSTARTITFDTQFLGTLPIINDCTSTKWYLIMILCVSASHFAASAMVVKS